MKIFVFGSSIVSSYWNGAATYYRGCYKYLARRGHTITFAEPDAYDRQQHRDTGEDFSYVTSRVYEPGVDVDATLSEASSADVVIKHSGLGVDDALLERRVLECLPRSVVLFWDVDAPATIARLRSHPSDDFHGALSHYDAIVTYGGGPEIEMAYRTLGAKAYYSIYNGLDAETHHPVPIDESFSCDLAFLGNRLPDREARVEQLFLEAAKLAPEKTFLLGGEGWGDKSMPSNVRWIGHVPTALHNTVNSSAAMVININRTSMAAFGYAPPTRVFEAAGAGASLVCVDWPGISEFFAPEREILVVRSACDVVNALERYDDAARRNIGEAFRARALHDHTYAQRAIHAEAAILECLERRHTIQAPRLESNVVEDAA
jgi:spore maturation protein CgeB